MPKRKVILISDIHLGTRDTDYWWLNEDYAGQTAAMLRHVSHDQDVEELVFVGDLFDTWLCALDAVPDKPEAIVAAWEACCFGRPLVEAVRECVAAFPRISYLRGNHDMHVKASDLVGLSAGGKQIEMVHTCDLRKRYAYMRVEHGHEADLFNRPYPDAGDRIGDYPLGFFITRLLASAKDKNKALADLSSALAAPKFLGNGERGLLSKLLVGTIVNILVAHAWCNGAPVSDSTPIRFAEPDLDAQGITVGAVKGRYCNLLAHAPSPNLLETASSLFPAVLDHGLDWYARKLLKGDRLLRILVMGHTHHGGVGRPYWICRGIYANCGCSCDASGKHPRPTFVEVGRHGREATVSLFQWNRLANAPELVTAPLSIRVPEVEP